MLRPAGFTPEAGTSAGEMRREQRRGAARGRGEALRRRALPCPAPQSISMADRSAEPDRRNPRMRGPGNEVVPRPSSHVPLPDALPPEKALIELLFGIHDI